MPLALPRTVPLVLGLSPARRVLEIAVDDSAVHEYLGRTYAAPSESSELLVDHGVVTSLPQPRATWNGEEILPAPDRGTLPPWRTPLYLAEQLVWNSLAMDECWAALYACAAIVRGRAVVVVGESGAGKTTLANALATIAGGAFADEMLALHRRDRLVAAVRRTAIVRPPTHIAGSENDEQLPGSQSAERYVRLPERWLQEWPAPLGAVALIEGRAQRPLVRVVSAGRVALRLAPAIVRRRHDLDSLVAATALFSGMPILSLALGSPDESAAAVLDLVQSCW